MKKLLKLLNIIGIFIMLLIIIIAAPLTIPKLLGFQIYAALSGSMEPSYPVGSIIYVQKAEADQIQTGDVISFYLPEEADVVMTHRVTQINTESKEFITKGDANELEDEDPVAFNRLIGKPVLCIPKFALVSNLMNTATGKAIVFSLFAFSFICWIVADLLSGTAKKKKKQKNKQNTDAEEKNTNTRKLNSRRVLQIVFLILIVVSAWGLISAMLEYQRGTNEYKQLQETVGETPSNKESNQEVIDNIFRPNESIINEFQNLKSQNTDMMAWIAFDTLDISYPVMKGQDNLYYLTHTFSGKTNSSGSIFMEVGNAGDFADCHTLIYGHNMKNGAMFGHLKKYREEEFYKGNEYFTIYLEDKYLRYQIFSVHTVSVTDPVYTIGFAPNEEFADFVDRLNRQAWYDTGIKANVNSKVVTLSTCTSSDDSRYVVHALLIEETEYQ